MNPPNPFASNASEAPLFFVELPRENGSVLDPALCSYICVGRGIREAEGRGIILNAEAEIRCFESRPGVECIAIGIVFGRV